MNENTVTEGNNEENIIIEENGAENIIAAENDAEKTTQSDKEISEKAKRTAAKTKPITALSEPYTMRYRSSSLQ